MLQLEVELWTDVLELEQLYFALEEVVGDR